LTLSFIAHASLVPFVYRIAVQFNDNIVLSGLFDEVNAESRTRIARLEKDGDLDPTFLSTVSFNNSIDSLILQPDGKILLSGFFDMVNGTYCPQIARLNANGTLDTTFAANAPWPQARVYALALESDGKILFGGSFTDLSGTSRNRLGRLNPTGTLDMDYDPDVGGGDVLALAVQSDGGHLVGGKFQTVNLGIPNPWLARLHPNGLRDWQLGPLIMTHTDPLVLTKVYAVALQPDRDILIGGDFTTFYGNTTRNNIARIKPNGNLDNGFTPVVNNTIYSILIQPDGKIVIGGKFSEVNGIPRINLARLEKDGSLDTSFNPNPDGPVRAMALQPDGKLWVGGDFTNISGSPSQRIARLNSNGSADMTISPGANNLVYTLALETDGSLLVGGTFTQLSGESRLGIGRLLSNGALDLSFDPATDNLTKVHVMAVQPDGKILVGGEFSEMDGEIRNNIARLETSGATDTDFSPNANSIVHAIALQRDGSIYVGGEFEILDGVSQNSLGKLDQDGEFITEFDNRTDGEVYALALQEDGKLLVGGQFGNMIDNSGSQARSNFARLSVDTPALQSLLFSNNNTELEWTRHGSMPVVSAVNFAVSTDGSTFTDLGSGTRTADGWGLTGLSLSAGTNLWVRGTGFYAGGLGAGSGSVIQITWNVYLLEAPTFSSADNTSFMVENLESFSIITTGIPVPSISLSGALPAGVSFADNDDGTGSLSGTPTPGTEGDYPLTITASNGAGSDATMNFTLSITSDGSGDFTNFLPLILYP
jgi:uncharacterized delta-60 repeat protein